MSRRTAPWFLLFALVALVLMLSYGPAAAQTPDTVAVKSVEDTVQVRQTGTVVVEQDRLVRLALILTPVFIVFGGALTGYIGVLAKRAEAAASLAVLVAQRDGKKHTSKLNRIERLGNSLSDAQNQRIDELTAALTANKVAVPPRKTRTSGGGKKLKARARARARRV